MWADPAEPRSWGGVSVRGCIAQSAMKSEAETNHHEDPEEPALMPTYGPPSAAAVPVTCSRRLPGDAARLSFQQDPRRTLRRPLRLRRARCGPAAPRR